jgi:hypothetical protein
MAAADHVFRYLRGTYEKGSCLTEALSAGSPADRIPSLFLLLKPNTWQPVKEARRSCTSVLSFRMSVSLNKVVPISLATVAMSTNPVRRNYSPHIHICRHYVRELALAGIIKLVPFGTHDGC